MKRILACLVLAACQTLAAQTGRVASEGYVDAGGSVRLFYRLVGSGSDTVVVLHGGPGFTMDYLFEDLVPMAKDSR